MGAMVALIVVFLIAFGAVVAAIMVHRVSSVSDESPSPVTTTLAPRDDGPSNWRLLQNMQQHTDPVPVYDTSSSSTPSSFWSDSSSSTDSTLDAPSDSQADPPNYSPSDSGSSGYDSSGSSSGMDSGGFGGGGGDSF